MGNTLPYVHGHRSLWLPDDVHMLPSLLGPNLLHEGNPDLLQEGRMREGSLHVLCDHLLLRDPHEDVLPDEVRVRTAFT